MHRVKLTHNGLDQDRRMVSASGDIGVLRLSQRPPSDLRLQGNRTRSISRSRLTGGTQRLKECNESRSFRGAQILPVSGHVPSPLNHLADELVLCSPYSHIVQGRPPLSANVSKGVTVTALLALKDEGTLPLKRGSVL